MENVSRPSTQADLPIPIPLAPLASPDRQQCVPAGEAIFTPDDVNRRQYLLVSGEVIILRNGQIVDLVESGELLDPAIWPGAMAVAWHASILQPWC